MEHTDYAIASGTITGRDHRNINVPRNNQDGLAVVRIGPCTVAVVTDGCGSSDHSEVGAKIGARLTAEAVARQAAENGMVDWERVLDDVLGTISLLALQLGGMYARTIKDYFLFTIVGVVLDNQYATFFALGDGIVVVNGRVHQLGPFPGNQPPYGAYRLLDGKLDSYWLPPQIEIIETRPLSDLQHFLIGCDGVSDLIAVASRNLPGLDEPVRDISQFWEQESFFDPLKPDLLNRRLRVIGRDWPKKNPESGLLPDDTTIVVGRKFSTAST